MLAIAVAVIVGPSLTNVVLVLAVTAWVSYFRVVRAEVLAVRESLLVDAARTLGASTPRIVLRHVLPNVSASVIVIASLMIANMIIFEASLSFLGRRLRRDTAAHPGCSRPTRSPCSLPASPAARGR